MQRLPAAMLPLRLTGGLALPLRLGETAPDAVTLGVLLAAGLLTALAMEDSLRWAGMR